MYIFQDQKRNLIYVGKSKLLKSRVNSYFTSKKYLSPKTKLLVEQITRVDVIVTESEFEAILLEARLIRTLMPKYNSQLRDDKSPLYIYITDDVYPKVILVRKTDLSEMTDKNIFGPFLSARQAASILKTARRIFPFCSKTQANHRPCFYTHLGLCPGACVQQISPIIYHQTIKNLKLFLSGKVSQVKKNVKAEMLEQSSRQDFESAETSKQKLLALEALTKYSVGDDVMIKYQPIDWTADLRNLLMNHGINLAKDNSRIEGYDISNLQGRQATASMVVFTNGQENKNEYRQFRIRSLWTPDDPRMIVETLTRRLNHSEWNRPDLILIDGGVPQLAAIQREFRCRELIGDKIPFIGLAKENEDIVIPTELDYVHLRLPKDNPGLLLLMRIRDEAHRFARRYHHQLRQKSILR